MYYKVKKLFAFLIIGILLFQAIIPTSIRAEASEEVETREITTNILSTNRNPSFEELYEGKISWWYGNASEITQSEDAKDGKYSMKVEPSTTGSYVGGEPMMELLGFMISMK